MLAIQTIRFLPPHRKNAFQRRANLVDLHAVVLRAAPDAAEMENNAAAALPSPVAVAALPPPVAVAALPSPVAAAEEHQQRHCTQSLLRHTLWPHEPMALLVELHDLKDLAKRLQYDLGNDNDKLQCVNDENKRLLAVVKDLETELRVARTVAAASDVVMVPIPMQLAAVAKGGETKEHIFERMDVDTCPGMDTCEISAECYKTKWFDSDWKPVHEIGCIFPAEILRQLPGLKKIDAMLLFGKSFRRLGDTANDDNGNSIAGYFLILDMIHALFFARRSSARTWCMNVKHINKTIAPSLASIPSGNPAGGKHYVASYVDALRIIVRYCKMTDVVFDIGNVLVEEERAITNVNDTLAKCEEVSLSVYDKRKLESQCLGEKKEAVCDLHDASAPCVGCKRKISELGYRQHCIQCYVNLFPATRYEMIVRGVIDATFEGFIHNKVIPSYGQYNTCLRQIDHRLQIGNTILAVETDERAHANYDKYDEQRRYNEFTSTYPHKFVFIRFNPHANMEEQHVRTDFTHKLGVLVRSIRCQMFRIRAGSNVNKLEIMTLFGG